MENGNTYIFMFLNVCMHPEFLINCNRNYIQYHRYKKTKKTVIDIKPGYKPITLLVKVLLIKIPKQFEPNRFRQGNCLWKQNFYSCIPGCMWQII